MYKDLDAVRSYSPFITLQYDGNGSKGGDGKKGAPGVHSRPSAHRHPASAQISTAAAFMTSTRPARQVSIQHAGTLDLVDIPAKLKALAEDWDRKYGSTAMDVRIVPYECGSTERYVTAGPGRSTEKNHQALSAATGLGFAHWSNAHHTNTNPGDTTQSPVQVMVDNLSPAVTVRDIQVCRGRCGRTFCSSRSSAQAEPTPQYALSTSVRTLEESFRLFRCSVQARASGCLSVLSCTRARSLRCESCSECRSWPRTRFHSQLLTRSSSCIVADGRQLSVQLANRPFQV